jgi:hypothetical protein
MMKRFVALLLVLFPLVAAAQGTPPSTLNGAHYVSPTQPVGTSGARFRIGLSRDNGTTFTTTASATETVRVVGDLLPPAAHLGKRVDVVVVDLLNGKPTMLDQNGHFVSWNGMVPDLVPVQKDVVLSAETRLDLFRGKLGIGSEHLLFLAYLLNGEVHFTAAPHMVTVTGGETAYLIPASAETYRPGSVLVLDYTGPALGGNNLQASVDGLPALGAMKDGQLYVAIPPGAANDAEVIVTAGGKTLRQAITVAPSAPLLRPREYVRDVFDDVLAQWEQDTTNPFRAALGALKAAREAVATMSETEVAQLAVLLQQITEDDPELTRALALSLSLESESLCEDRMNEYVRAVAKTVNDNKEIAAVAVVGVALLLEAPPIGGAILLIAAAKVVLNVQKVGISMEALLESCIGINLASLRSEFGNNLHALSTSGQVFNSGTERRLAIDITRGFTNSASQASFTQALNQVRQSVLDIGSKLGIDASPLLSYIKVEGMGESTVTDLSDFTLRLEGGTSTTGVSGTISGRGSDWIGLRFDIASGAGAQERNFVAVLSSAKHKLDLQIPVRLLPNNAQLEVSASATLQLPDITGRGDDESKIYRLLKSVKPAPLTGTFTLRNPGTSPLIITGADFIGQPPAQIDWTLGTYTLQPGATTTLSYSVQMTPESYGKIGPLGVPAAPIGKRFYLYFKESGGKLFHYAIELWFVPYGAYDMTRVATSPQRDCAVPNKTITAAVSGMPNFNQTFLRFNDIDVLKDGYNPQDGSFTFSRDNIRYGEEGGMVTESVKFRIDAQGKLTGSSTWTWTDLEDECKGTATYTGQIR